MIAAIAAVVITVAGAVTGYVMTPDMSTETVTTVDGRTFVRAAEPDEDSPAWDCRRHGDHICGPGGKYRAGCYRDGELVIPWTDYRHPERDPLYGHVGTCRVPRVDRDTTDVRA